MTLPPDDQPDDRSDDMHKAVELRKEREEKWRQTGERPLWRNLSMIGAYGWLIVAPTLLGVAAGRWLDVQLDSGIFWSGALIMLGAALGSYLVWQRMERD